LALAVPLSRFTSRVGGGSAFYVRLLHAFSMTPHSLKMLIASSWAVLLVCVVAFFYFAIAIPNVVSQSVITDSAKHLQQIRASTDLHEVQQIATWRTQEEAGIMDSSRMLLIMSVAIFLLCGICSVISLWQLRRLKRHLRQGAP